MQAKQTQPSFQVKTGTGMTTAQLAKAGNYDYAEHHFFSGKRNFQVKTDHEEKFKIVLLEFDEDKSTRKVLKEAIKLGLERPTFEQALHFGVQHPKEHKKGGIVFLHKPKYMWLGACGILVRIGNVVALSNVWGKPFLWMLPKSQTWDHGKRFAFVQPKGQTA